MKFAEKTIEDFLFTPGRSFVIPEFQRPYSWKVENAREFIYDLEESIAHQRSHYFGTVVFVLDDISSSSIIDGQQRVTTSLLMLIAIYHLLLEDSELSKNPSINASSIRDNYLLNRNNTNRVKLRTVTTDDLILQKIFDTQGNPEKLTPEEIRSNLYQNYSEFKRHLSTKEDVSIYLEGLRRFEIVTIALDSRDDNPQKVFESINSTGKPLSDGDKIRNFALMLSSDELQKHVYEKYWKEIETELTGDQKDTITDFFRSYMTSKKQALIRMDAVYPEFKQFFNSKISGSQSKSEIDNFYSDIVTNLKFYTFLKFGKKVGESYELVDDTAFKMRYLQTDLYIPYGLSVIDYYKRGNIPLEELKNTFDIIEAYFSRRLICGINTTSVDRLMITLHREVISVTEKSPETSYSDALAFTLLSRGGQTRLPSDEEVTQEIHNRNMYMQKKSSINYILAAANDNSNEANTLRQIASGELKNISIEHIMPQTLTDSWRSEIDPNNQGEIYIQEVHNKYLHTLANLTLTGYNSTYSNRPFTEKKTIPNGFSSSPLRINQYVKDTEKWDKSAMGARAEWWTKQLNAIWPLPKTSYTPADETTTVRVLEETDLKGASISSVTIYGEETPVASWAEAQDTIVEYLYDKHPGFIAINQNDPVTMRWVSQDSSKFYNSAEIYETGYFTDTSTDTNTKLRFIHRLSELFDIESENLTIKLK